MNNDKYTYHLFVLPAVFWLFAFLLLLPACKGTIFELAGKKLERSPRLTPETEKMRTISKAPESIKRAKASKTSGADKSAAIAQTSAGKQKKSWVQKLIPFSWKVKMEKNGNKSPAPKNASPNTGPKAKSNVLTLYKDKYYPSRAYLPTGWMGDWGDLNYEDGHSYGVHSGTTCIRVEYGARMTQGHGWAGIYWQYPQNNWGSYKNGGRNLAKARKLVFWAKGEKGKEVISEFIVGGISGEYPDTDRASIGPVKLTNKWSRYEIKLKRKNLKRISGGFAWAINVSDNPTGAIFYLDDIEFIW
ncbi:hypothetical protein ACFL6Y_09490 [Elusimicrobiota bacterium]